MAAAAAVTSAGIAAARKALTDALAAARALEAPSDDSERTARAARLAVKADAAEDEDIPMLRAAESRAGAGWSASSLAIGRESLGTPEIPGNPRTLRRNPDGTDADTLLTAEEIPAVTYEDGKVVMSPGLSSGGDRLRMRGIPVANTLNSPSGDLRRFLLMGVGYDPRSYVDRAGGGNDGEEPRMVAGLKITSRGLVVDMGGRGAFGLDFRRPNNFFGFYRFVTPGGSTGGYDLKLEFGLPKASPEGNAEHYWTAQLMPAPEHLQEPTLGSRLRDGERVIPLGTYTMRLSNHAGLDRNLEDPDDPAGYARDDVNHYLSYAAYGHMEFVDSSFTAGSSILPGRRTFPFHSGYDAFKDEAGMSTTDVADADKITGGTFRGRTMASQFAIETIGTEALPSLTGANYLRLRGNVRLTATISGTADDNRISGRITNLESFSNSKGIWEDYARISSALTLQASDISASGSFAGVIDPASYPSAVFAEGGYRGNFYGPTAGLEAAGIWYLQDGNTASSGLKLSIVGSFGAALVREDGTYGVEVGLGG